MRKNKGGALITALILVTLSTTLVSSLFSQQLIQLRFLENKRNFARTENVLKKLKIRILPKQSKLVTNIQVFISPTTQFLSHSDKYSNTYDCRYEMP